MSTVTQERPAGPEVERPARSAAQRTSGRTLILLGVFLLIGVMLAFPMRSWLSQRANLAEMRADIEAAEQRVQALQAERDNWYDPIFIEEQARLRLNMVRAGEIGLRTLKTEEVAPEEPTVELPDVWWGRLWASVEEKSGRQPAKVGDQNSTVEKRVKKKSVKPEDSSADD